MNYKMQHPIVTIIGYILALSGAIFIGMVAGCLIDDELVQQRSAPALDHVPSPKVFRGVG